MFNDFTFYNPTKIHFGKKSLEKLAYELKPFKKIMLVYEEPIIKQIGLYDDITRILNKEKVEFVEFNKIKANPLDTLCEEGAKIANKENVELILAVGGGSTIDASKAISLISTNIKDRLFDYIEGSKEPKFKPLKIGVILTSAATSSENSPALVVTNSETHQKLSYFSQDIFPKFAICNPSITISLPAFQTASGAFDIMSHDIEQFLSLESFDASEIPTIQQIKVLKKWVPISLRDPSNYEARANIMWCSTLALNGHAYIGKNPGWYAHGLSYPLTSEFNIPHGAAVALIFPTIIDYQLKKGNNIERFKDRIKVISKLLFDDENVEKFSNRLRKLINEWGLYTDIKKYNIEIPSSKKIEELSKIGFLGHSNKSFLDTEPEVAKDIYKMLFGFNE